MKCPFDEGINTDAKLPHHELGAIPITCPGCAFYKVVNARFIEKMAKLRPVLETCGTSTDNPDTCGVCGKHFKECEEERVAEEVETSDGTKLSDDGFACPGARARELLKETQ